MDSDSREISPRVPVADQAGQRWRRRRTGQGESEAAALRKGAGECPTSPAQQRPPEWPGSGSRAMLSYGAGEPQESVNTGMGG